MTGYIETVKGKIDEISRMRDGFNLCAFIQCRG